MDAYEDRLRQLEMEFSSDFQDDGRPNSLAMDSGDPVGCADKEPNIIAICTAGNRSGCAIYRESTVNLVADRRDPGDPYKGLDIVIQKTDPDVVIVSTAQRKLITFLEKIFNFKTVDIYKSEKPTDDVPDPAFTLAIVPNNWFSMSYGEQKLIESEWVKNCGITDPDQKPFFVFSRVRKSVDVCAIRAISALDRYLLHEFTTDPNNGGQLVATGFEATVGKQVRAFPSQVSQATRTTNEPKNADNLMPILNVRYIDPGPVLSVDKFTLQTLNIFSSLSKKDRERRIIVSDDCSDPNPSLFDIFNQCYSAQGRKTMLSMMLWPLQEIDELRHRHAVIDYFLRPENRIFKEQLAMQLKSTVPLARILSKLSHSVCSYKELSSLYKTLWSYVGIIDIIAANNCTEIEAFNRIVSLDSPALRATIDSIVNIVDFDASKNERRLQIHPGVDENVDKKRDVAKNLEKFCSQIGIQETAKYKDILGKTCEIAYIPRIGFLCSVQFNSTAELDKITMNREFDVILHTEQSVYFKTRRMEELDYNAGDIACDLIDVQEDIVVNLQNEILNHSEKILQLMELFGELDCLITFATVSCQRGFVRPEFVSSSDELEIIGAYHPLQNILGNVVPNDVKFYKDDDGRKKRVMVVTGPNSCGKTTYMKAACLVVYIAHIGCFVPAASAKIPIIDAILTRMHSANSISTGLSSFATDLHQINYALSRATERSLIVVDEFGKGTLARDGFNLLKGLVAYFAGRGRQSPYVIVSTHFNNLVNHLTIYSESILYKTFKVMRDTENDTIIYEYRLIDGVSESSLADQVAAKAGIPFELIQRANQIREYITDGRPFQPRPTPPSTQRAPLAA